MKGRATTRGVRAAAAAVTVLMLVAACSDDKKPPVGSPATSAPGSPVAPATTAAPATSGPPSASYTKPPSRNLTRPAGVAAVSNSTCGYAQVAIHFVAASWGNNQVPVVTAGHKVPDDMWAEGAQVLPTYKGGIEDSRSRLKSQKVPESYAVYQDMADADAAIDAAIAAAKAKDDSRVIPVYLALRTAEDHFTESCGVLEDKPAS
ncbi:hypothetical protein ACQP1P_19640 [Dactylosporangium sp. CA-052675]|uniref:hypothetical protein n=1 Tax=Dactylosporangium sp. CA-052675 TaxID=3239927 RepID=UPI003D8C0441